MSGGFPATTLPSLLVGAHDYSDAEQQAYVSHRQYTTTRGSLKNRKNSRRKPYKIVLLFNQWWVIVVAINAGRFWIPMLYATEEPAASINNP